ISVLPIELWQAAEGYQPFSRHPSGDHGAARDLPLRDFCGQSQAIFPAAALVAWAALAYLCVDFGFWHKLFQLTSEDNGTYRAAAEAGFAASVLIFIYTFLNLRLWHSWITIAFFGWTAGQLGLIVFALVDAQATASLARLSFLPIA